MKKKKNAFKKNGQLMNPYTINIYMLYLSVSVGSTKIMHGYPASAIALHGRIIEMDFHFSALLRR